MSNERMSIPWSRVAGGLALVALASVTALVVVASVKGADTLSTVALAVAVVAFAAQLAIAITQGQAAADQRVRAEEINGDTRAVLVEISTTTAGVFETIKSQFNRLLERALGEAVPEAVDESTQGGEKFDPEEFEKRLITKLDQRLYTDPYGTSPLERAGISQSALTRRIREQARSRPTPYGAEKLNLAPGDGVWHDKWGPGRIVETKGEADKAEAKVVFPDVGQKRLMLKWAPMRRYEPGDEIIDEGESG